MQTNKYNFICFVYIPEKLFCSKCNNILVCKYKNDINDRICKDCQDKNTGCITKKCYNICIDSDIVCNPCKKNKKIIKSKFKCISYFCLNLCDKPNQLFCNSCK